MRAADDGAVGTADGAVAVQILELDPAGARPVGPERRRVRGVTVVPLRDQTVKRADRLADHVDHRVLLAQRDRPREGLRPQVVDLEDLVLIVAAVERDAPQRPRPDRVVIADREVDAGVAHLPDVDDRRRRGARGCRRPRVEQQVVRVAAIEVGAERPAPFQELEVQPDVGRALLFPLEVRVPDGGLLEARPDGRARAADVVERVAAVAAELADDPSRRNLLVPRHAISEPQHRVREGAFREKRFPGEPPACADRRERAPAVFGREARRPVAPHRQAQIVAFAVVVVGLAEERQQGGPPAAARDVLGGRIAERILDVARIDGRVEQLRAAAGLEAVGVPARLLAKQHRQVVLAHRPRPVQRVAPRPLGEQVVVLIDPVHVCDFRVLRRGRVVSVEGPLAQVEAEPGLQRQGTGRIIPREDVPEDPVIGGPVVLAGVGDLERVGQVAQPHRLAGSEVPGDVVDRHHGLLHDVLADDVVFPDGVVIEPAVVPLARHGDVLADLRPPHVERGVDPHAAALQAVERRGAFLIEEVERDVVGVVVATT